MVVYQRVIHKIIFWLVGATYPSEKWWSESQLGWWHSVPKCFWKVIKKIFQSPTRTQSFFAKKSPMFQHTPFSGHRKVHLNSDPMWHSAWCFSPLQMVTGWSPKNPLLGWTHRAKKVSQLVVKTWWKVHEKLGSSALVAASVLPNAVLPATSAAHSSDLLAHSPRPRCEREKNQTRGVLKCGIL